MIDLMLDIKNLLTKNRVQKGLNNYLIEDIKTYCDLEMDYHIAIKVYDRIEERIKVYIMSLEDLDSMNWEIKNEEDTIKWFDEIDK